MLSNRLVTSVAPFRKTPERLICSRASVKLSKDGTREGTNRKEGAMIGVLYQSIFADLSEMYVCVCVRAFGFLLEKGVDFFLCLCRQS